MIVFQNLGNYGRLGNSCFQLATLINVALYNNYEYGIPFKNETPTYFVQDPRGFFKYGLEIHKCFNLIIKDSSFYSDIKYTFEPKGFEYDPEILNIKDNTNLFGYFQSEKYFEETKDIIRDELRFKTEITIEADKIFVNYKNPNKELVAIHVRRGDYTVLQEHHTNLTLEDYYLPAMKMFDKNKTNFLIFSDDVLWCKNKFVNDGNIFYSEERSTFIDLCLMSMCDHAIIANSSFSWWGAYLQRNSNKLVIAPKNWFGPKHSNLNTQDLIPKTWIKL